MYISLLSIQFLPTNAFSSLAFATSELAIVCCCCCCFFASPVEREKNKRNQVNGTNITSPALGNRFPAAALIQWFDVGMLKRVCVCVTSKVREISTLALMLMPLLTFCSKFPRRHPGGSSQPSAASHPASRPVGAGVSPPIFRWLEPLEKCAQEEVHSQSFSSFW